MHARLCPPALEPLVQDLREWPEVLALRLGGSVARGQADEFSDVDFYAACTRLPSLDRRRHCIALRRDRGTPFFVDEAAPWGVLDTFYEAGHPVTVLFQEVATIEQGLEEILASWDLDREKEMAFGQEIRDGKILYDAHGLAATWQAQVQAYTPRRQGKVQEVLTRWQQQVARELEATPADPLWIAYRLQETWEWLVHGLCALHGRYYIGPKRTLASLADFVERPPEAPARLAESWSMDLNPRALHAVWQPVMGEILAAGSRILSAPQETAVPRRMPGLFGGPRERTGALEKAPQRPPATESRERARGPMESHQEALIEAFHRGGEGVVERLKVAAQRGDAPGFLYCQQKALEAMVQVLWALQGWSWPGVPLPRSSLRLLGDLRHAPPALYDRLCSLWAGNYRPESLVGKRRQWLELWSELVPLIYQQFPAVDLYPGEQALARAWSKD